MFTTRLIKSIGAKTPLLTMSISNRYAVGLIATKNFGAALQFSTSSVIQAKQASPEKKKLQELGKQLKKEKATFKKLKEKLSVAKAKEAKKKKAAKAKEAQLKAKKKNDKLLATALKSYRKISPFNMYVKESKGSSFGERAQEWSSLPDYEKDEFKLKADEYNEEQLKIYTPKPKAPVFGFAAFLKENYVNEGRDVQEQLKELAQEWKSLSDSEKSNYAKNDSEWQKYTSALNSWKQGRVDLYNKNNGTNLTL